MILSVIVLSYNTKEMTRRHILHLDKLLRKEPLKGWEIIIVDNGSRDGSKAVLKKIADQKKNVKLIVSKKNLGFSKGNNLGVSHSQGKYLLFVNSDVLVNDVNFAKIINFLEKKPRLAALTVKVLLPNGKIDPASHRGFPSLWNSFTYFTGLERVFRKVPYLNYFFGGYHQVYKNFNKIHQIDSPSGAFFLVKRSLFNQVNGFDEDFFMYGEDIDLSYRLKELGYNIIYYPDYTVTHYKYSSGLAASNRKIKRRVKENFYQAMKIFFRHHYASQYPNWFNKVIYRLIDLKKTFQ